MIKLDADTTTLENDTSSSSQHRADFTSENTTDELGTMERVPQQTLDSPLLPPEEGRKGWLCVVGSFVSIFCSFGFLNA